MDETSNNGAGPSEAAPEERPAHEAIFRPAALEAHRQGETIGRPLHIVSAWARWSVVLVLVAVVTALLFVAFVRVGEYAEGVAVVRREGRVVVTSTVSGTVQRIEVKPGQRVAEGQPLVRLDDAAQQAEAERIRQEYEQQLIELLRYPADAGARARLAALGAQLQLAEAHLVERIVTAPAAGLVSDVRVRPGLAVGPGDTLVSIEQKGGRTVVVAMFPGHYRPLLAHADTRMLLELEGFPRDRIAVELRSVADEVVGPAEALRYLGQDLEGALDLRGPVVIVETVLASDSFQADDGLLRVYDGMQGRLEARLRSQTLLQTLMPSVERR